jgi:hypothetical protein
VAQTLEIGAQAFFEQFHIQHTKVEPPLDLQLAKK